MTGRVNEAFHAVPRVHFLPPEMRAEAVEDLPLPIGYGATNSQPSTVARMLDLLEVRPGDRVLDVGSGSGWTTALLAWLTGATGSVLGVEIIPELIAPAQKALDESGFTWATIQLASPDVLGAPESGPFDRILVSADGGEIPRALIRQLAEGGRLVLPAAGQMMVIERTDAGVRQFDSGGRWRFVPLLRASAPLPNQQKEQE